MIVVYGAVSGILRRLIVPSYQGEDLGQPILAPGEASLVTEGDPVVAVTQAMGGITPPSGRCVIVSPLSVVLAVTMADPLIDDPTMGGQYPGAIMVLNSTAGVGDIVVAT